MYNGLWVIEFETELGYGSGVLFINGSQVLGGDFGYYYSGQVNITENTMTGEFNVIRFNHNAVSVFGDLDNFTLMLKDGTINKTSFKANATIKDNQDISIEIRGKKKVDTDETH